jgi:hypothetical protein
MKKVIFVGGTSYSGSTMLDMILSNDEKGYSLGEVIALFRPFKNHYQEEREKIFSKKDPVWYQILKNGPNSLYPTLFKEFENKIDFFVDSSKNPFWIAKQTKILKEMGVDVQNVLIYKNPFDLAHSYNKRKRYNDWESAYVKYHIQYINLIEDFFTVSYKDVVSNDEIIKEVCSYVGIDFYVEKNKFWLNKKITTFFGNDRTRYHKFNKEQEIIKSVDTTSIDKSNDYQNLYYYPCKDDNIIKKVNDRSFKNKNIVQINKLLELLNTKDSKSVDINSIKIYNKAFLFQISKANFRFRNFILETIGSSIFHAHERYLLSKRLNKKDE